ncbi:MAG: DinB family protein [Treponema sp.]|jgi:uncharacterized damage-inducible protein DinB|nr:DinB family protein [Treponema sp.]
MQTDTVKILAAYNQAATAKMNETIKTLSADEWNKALGGFFPSVRSLCSHIFTADLSWLKRFSKAREFASLKDPLLNQEIDFKELRFPTVEEYLKDRLALDNLLSGFAQDLSGEDLAQDLSYANSSGQTFTKNFGGLALHLFVHSAHHRGMISLYLELLGHANDFNSLSQVL